MSTTELKKSEVDATVLAISNAIEQKSVVTPNDVRLALMDYSDKNIPLYQEHLTDEMLWKCIEWGVSHFNDTPPTISKQYTLATFPKRKLMLDLAVVEALKLTALVELRGEMQYNDGGIQSTIYYKSQQFNALRQELQAKVEQEIIATKRSININSCYGGLC